MEMIALVAQPEPNPVQHSDGINAAGWGVLLWVGVLAFVLIALLAVAGMSLRNR